MLPSALDIADQVRSRRRKAVDVTREALQVTARLNPQLGAFLEVTEEAALQQAERVDAALDGGSNAGPLAGVPVAVKDNICTLAGRTTCASRILQNYRSPYNATVVERIEAAGGVILGKTNCDEFAMGSSTESSAFLKTRNPWRPECVPGGSSGGSAVAVAAGMTPLALGSETGGSVRQPAALCGLVGLKPTYGRVSRYGLVAYGSSLDQVAPFARSVTDAALLLRVISGADPLDSTSVAQMTPDYVAELHEERLAGLVDGLRIGVPREYFGDGLDPEVRAAVEEALRLYEKLGARRVDISLPHSPQCVAVYYLVATAECSSNLARYDGVHYGLRARGQHDIIELYSRSRAEGFGDEVKRRIMLGAFALSAGYYDAYYTKALRVRRLIQQDFDAAFRVADVIACPTSPTPAFRFGEKTDDPLQMYLADIYTIAANLAGIPGISIPCGFSQARLPIGLQLMGPAFGEALLLQTARIYERETDWGSMSPPGAT